MYTYVFNRISLLLSEYEIFDNTTGPATALNKVPNKKLNNLAIAIDGLGMESYDLVFKFAIFSCVISLVGIIVARLIFRIASPREDARAKMLIQTTLVITFVISMVLTLFGVVINIAGGL